MNKKQLLLGDYFESGKGKTLVNSKRSPVDQRLQHTLSQHYSVVCELVSKHDLQIELDQHTQDPFEKLNHMVGVIQYLLGREKKQEGECEDCRNYESHLQKLEADVRQHIRLEQQLKLYQDSIEEKNQEMKREHKVFEKEIESLRKKTEEFKHNHDKLARLQSENDQLRSQIRQMKSKSIEKPSSSQSQYRKFDSKTNIAEKFPLTRTINFSSNINTNEERKSLDKKTVEHRVDPDKYRQSLTNKSSNILRPPTDRKKYEDKSVFKDKQNQRRRQNKAADIRK